MGFYRVSKALIVVTTEGEASYLMSIKRDPGSAGNGKREFPGGRWEPRESPREALIRELREEEQTGRLSAIAADRASLYFPMIVANAEYFLFPFHLTHGEFASLAHHPLESLGFELVLHADMKVDPDYLTAKTNIIIESLAI